MNRKMLVSLLSALAFAATSVSVGAIAKKKPGLTGTSKKRSKGVGITHRAKIMGKQAKRRGGGKIDARQKKMIRQMGRARKAKGPAKLHHALKAKQTKKTRKQQDKRAGKKWNKTPKGRKAPLNDKQALEAAGF